uniref:MHC class I-like antigen recognition-like domain-containing protein n=1 Tax=Castor canadensis TaxID=51338 RepID=A0A8C0X0I6_CASCN
MLPNVLPLFLSSEYSLSFVLQNFLIHIVAWKKLLICHITLNLSCLLLSLLLPKKPGRLGAITTHHLLLKFTVKSQSRPLQPWCEVLGSVDEQHVLKYDSDSNKVEPLSLLINKLNGTKNWTELTQTLGDIGRELRIILLDINGTEISTDGHPTLQARIICQHEGEQCIGAFCQFGINTKIFFQFDAMNNIWNVTDPVSSGIKHKWEHDRELGNFLRRISMGDCSHWLKIFLKELYGRL